MAIFAKGGIMIVYEWTKKFLNRNYSKEIIKKYGREIAILIQNGLKLEDSTEEEIEEQLEFYNFFKTKADLENLLSTYEVKSTDYIVGKKIFVEQIYKIVKDNNYLVQPNEIDVAKIKNLATIYWTKIGRAILDIEDLLLAKDSSELKGFIDNNISQIKNNLMDRLGELEEKYKDGKKVYTYLKINEILNSLYSLFCKYGKEKNSQRNLSSQRNFNDELYGYGGYNPNNGEIKATICSAIYNVKDCLTCPEKKLRVFAYQILSEPKVEEDEEAIKWLDKWLNYQTENNIEYARRVIISSLLIGILSMLSLKHNLTFIEEDNANLFRAEKIRKEFESVMTYCGITKEMLI